MIPLVLRKKNYIIHWHTLSKSPFTIWTFGAKARRWSYCSLLVKFPVQMTCCILFGTSIFKNFSGMARVRWGMCKSPSTSTSYTSVRNHFTPCQREHARTSPKSLSAMVMIMYSRFKSSLIHALSGLVHWENGRFAFGGRASKIRTTTGQHTGWRGILRIWPTTSRVHSAQEWISIRS